MICKRCQRSLRSSEGLKCATCESKYRLRCASEHCANRDSGDRGYQWKCALCQNYANCADARGSSGDSVSLLHAIHFISEKFELMNKIQLPKLNTDLLQIKTTADRIAKQNDDILRRINEIEDKRKAEASHQAASLRKRHVCFSHQSNKTSQNVHEVQMSFAEKAARYRTRRRSYLWYRIFNLVNRKVNRTSSPRKIKI